jgi:hypothetical protein
VDKQYANSDLSVILGKAGQPFTLDAQKDKERILAACDKLSHFVKQKYGSNIILCKVSLNDKDTLLVLLSVKRERLSCFNVV